MPWAKVSQMDNRMCFVASLVRGDSSMSEACARHGISRKTGYKWLGRYEACGVAGLAEQSRARLTQTAAIDPDTAALLRRLRERRPTWGPRKLLARLAMDHPGRDWPAASSAGDLLRREGLSKPRKRRRPGTGPKQPLIEPLAANDGWAMDFKGWFRTGDGIRCEPLTVSDGFSRYLLACEPVPRVTMAYVRPVPIRLFQTHGLPAALRSDNGSPFATRRGLGGLSRLSVWLLTLNIWPDFIDPGRPDRNGRHERMHRTLGEDTARPPAGTLALQQARMEAWREDYNTVRPHEAIGQRCPASLYSASARAWPAAIAAWEYPPDHHARRVSASGYVRWRDGQVYLTEALRGETVALAQRDDGDWTLRFRQFDLAVLSDENNEIRRTGLSRREGGGPYITSRDGIQKPIRHVTEQGGDRHGT